MQNQSDALNIIKQLADDVSKTHRMVETIEIVEAVDQLPVPNGALNVRTGEITMTIKLKAPAIADEFERRRRAWASEHPDMVPAYVNSKGK